MTTRADIVVMQALAIQYSGAGTNYVVQTLNGDMYIVFVDTGSDVFYTKSTNGGITWQNPVSVFTGTVTNLSVWYDRWSGISADLIHIAYTESATDDTLYRTINAGNSDTLSTQTTIFAGTSTANGGFLTIARARGGNVYCRTMIDAGTEGGFYRLPNANVPNGAWDAARTINEANATTDMGILVPGFAADNQDMMMIFWDASANQISRQIYDDSANSWAESIFSGTFTDTAATTSFPHFAAAIDLTNSQIIVVAWNAVDSANADLTCWTVTESAITAKTDVITNSTDDQALCAVGLDIDNGHWRVFYTGKTDGSETVGTNVNVYQRVSQDSGTTWGAESQVSNLSGDIDWLACTPRFLNRQYGVAWYREETLDRIMFSAKIIQGNANFQVGI